MVGVHLRFAGARQGPGPMAPVMAPMPQLPGRPWFVFTVVFTDARCMPKGGGGGSLNFKHAGGMAGAASDVASGKTERHCS